MFEISKQFCVYFVFALTLTTVKSLWLVKVIASKKQAKGNIGK